MASDQMECLTTNPNSEPKNAIQACDQYLSHSSLSPLERSDALHTRGVAHRELGQFEESLSDLKGALEIYPDDTSTMRMLAWTFREMGRSDKAEEIYTQVLKIDSHWQGWLSRCAVRYDLAKYNAAIEDCVKAGKQEYNLDVMYFKAAAEIQLDRPAQALETVTPGLSQDDFSGRLYFLAAIALWNMGLQSDATAKAEEGLKKYPGDLDLKRFLSP
ncbi:tetratricopeptide repeat protein [Aliiroseovarius sp. F20344]|uniref:tetratricopeptide repeat protein n=1 Tax=Aliiroseovarius sp. F20344 TaxID=2926414 RepID=UPI001FF1D35C|nr:tetratricopeptide repeat protein [Aliiroseovarius sp. F20344]MCK0142149.1 tetratricopeptide repeat protein [Aliiroseovarius sp. F20344]